MNHGTSTLLGKRSLLYVRTPDINFYNFFLIK